MSGKDAAAVRRLFDDVSPTYDLVNRLLTVGSDQRWRRTAALEVRPRSGALLVDLCGGTGRLAHELRRLYPDSAVLLLDFAEEMLRLAKTASRATANRGQSLPTAASGAGAVLPVVADALATPLAEGSCGGATMGFGLRNLADVDAGLREARRLLARGSRLVLLEFVRPTGLLAPIKCAVLRTFVPLVVRLVARSRVSAYAYLTRSITEFLSVEELTARLREVGFTDLTVQQRLLGIVAIVGATKR